MKPRPWRPLLGGRRAQEAMATVRSILRALGTRVRARAVDPSLAKGTAGIALLAAYHHDATRSRTARRLIDACLTSSLGSEARRGLPSVLLGPPGIAYVLHHLETHFGLASGAPLDEMDAQVAHALANGDGPVRFDLLRGAVGLGVYFLSRWPLPQAQHGIALVVDVLAGCAEPAAEGLAWRYHPEHFVSQRGFQQAPAGVVEAGLAEGASGVVALLAHARAAGVAHPRLDELLDGAVRFVLGARRRQRERLAWCIGDLGISVALIAAGRARGRRAWTQAGERLALAAAARTPEESGIVDGGLCHGAAGAAHIFARLHQWTGHRELARAARAWYGRTLGMCGHAGPRIGVAGYPSRVTGAEGAVWEDDPGVLRGAAGVALALLAGCVAREPAWDEVMLLGGNAAAYAR